MRDINVDNFKGIMERQLHLAKKCCRIVADLKSVVEARNYDRLEELVASFSAASIKLNLIEEERDFEFINLKEKTGLSKEDGFYDLLEIIEDREGLLGSLYSDLRVTVSKMQASVWVIDSYLRAMTSVLHSVMDNICPGVGGATYSKEGMGEKSKARGPMVLNFSA